MQGHKSPKTFVTQTDFIESRPQLHIQHCQGNNRVVVLPV